MCLYMIWEKNKFHSQNIDKINIDSNYTSYKRMLYWKIKKPR